MTRPTVIAVAITGPLPRKQDNPAVPVTPAGQIGRLEVARWAPELGGHCRTGLEDNVRYDATRLAAGSAELVGQVAAECDRFGRRPASAAEARRLLGLRAA